MPARQPQSRSLVFPARRRSAASAGKLAGFTLIEILIVVIILGILASIVIPQFSNATHDAREATLKDELRFLRTQLTIFKAQHRDLAPGYPNGDNTATPDATTFLAQMTQSSTDTCAVSATASSTYNLGPYLSQMPNNPMGNGSSGVLIAAGSTLPAPDPSQPYGWIYNPQTLQIIANLSGQDANGVLYADY